MVAADARHLRRLARVKPPQQFGQIAIGVPSEWSDLTPVISRSCRETEGIECLPVGHTSTRVIDEH